MHREGDEGEGGTGEGGEVLGSWVGEWASGGLVAPGFVFLRTLMPPFRGPGSWKDNQLKLGWDANWW